MLSEEDKLKLKNLVYTLKKENVELALQLAKPHNFNILDFFEEEFISIYKNQKRSNVIRLLNFIRWIETSYDGCLLHRLKDYKGKAIPEWFLGNRVLKLEVVNCQELNFHEKHQPYLLNLTRIDFIFSSLNNFFKDLHKLTNLRVLQITNPFVSSAINKKTDLSEWASSSLVQLQFLSSRNFDVNINWNNFPSLHTVHLQTDKDYNKNLFEHTGIGYLTLDVKKIPKEIVEMPNLKKLTIKHTHGLEKIPSFLLDIKNLQEIKIHNIERYKLPKQFYKQDKIKIIAIP